MANGGIVYLSGDVSGAQGPKRFGLPAGVMPSIRISDLSLLYLSGTIVGDTLEMFCEVGDG